MPPRVVSFGPIVEASQTMANCTNCGFQLDPELAPPSCPRCGTAVVTYGAPPVGLGAPPPIPGPPPPPPPGPGAPPAFDSDARPDSTLFGLPAQGGDNTEEPLFTPPSIPTPPPGASFGGLDAPEPPPVPAAPAAPQSNSNSLAEFEFDAGAGGLELDVGGGAASDNIDLPMPAAPRAPAPPRRPAAPPPRVPAPPPRSAAAPPGAAAGLNLSSPGAAPSNVGELDLPAPAARRSGSGLSNLDLPAPAAPRPAPRPKAPPPPPPMHGGGGAPGLDLLGTGNIDLPAPAPPRAPQPPAGLDLPPSSHLDLPQPVGQDGLMPVGLDLPIGAELNLPRPAGMDLEPADNLVAPASNLVAPADLDLEPAASDVAPADMGLAPNDLGLAPHDLGMLAPKTRGQPFDPNAQYDPSATADARPGFAQPKTPSPREVGASPVSRKLVYGVAALGLLGALGGGLYMAGVFDGDPPPPTARGLQPKTGTETKQPEKPAAPAAERSPEVLALLDADTPTSYDAAAKRCEAAEDAVGRAEAALLTHLRYGPDAVSLGQAVGLLKPYADATEPHVLRVHGLAALAHQDLERAEKLLASDGDRVQLYRGMLRVAQARPGDAQTETKAVRASNPKLVAAVAVELEAQLQLDPAGAYAALQSAVEAHPEHPGLSELLAKAALQNGALKVAYEAAKDLNADETAPAAYRARVATLRGQIAAARGDTPSALAQFEQALELSADNPTALEAQVRAGMAGNAFTIAITAMNRLRKLGPESVDYALLEVELQVAAGNGDDALTSIANLEKSIPERIELPFFRGEVQAMRLQVDEAQAEFAKVIEKDPAFHRVALAQAKLLAAARQPVEAVAALDAGVARLQEAKRPEATAELLTAKARLQLDQGQTQAALAALDAALVASPTDNPARVLRGQTRITEGNADGGQADLMQVYERAGGYPGLVAPLGRVFAARGDLEALEELVGDRARDPKASNEVKLVAARLRLAQGKPDDAKVLADEVIARASNSWEAQLIMSQAFLDAGDPAEALKRIGSVRPPQPVAELFLLKGKILEHNDKHGEARAEYQRAIAVEAGNLEAHFLLGRLLAYAGQAKQAIAELELVTSSTDGFPRAYLNMGRAQRDLGQNDDALVSFAKALELDASILEAHYLTGRIHLERNKGAKAVGELRAATQDAAKDEFWYPEAWLFLGRAHEKVGKRGAAKKAYQSFLEVAPEAHASRASVQRTLKSL